MVLSRRSLQPCGGKPGEGNSALHSNRPEHPRVAAEKEKLRGASPDKEMVINDERTRNVYDNK